MERIFSTRQTDISCVLSIGKLPWFEAWIDIVEVALLLWVLSVDAVVAFLFEAENLDVKKITFSKLLVDMASFVLIESRNDNFGGYGWPIPEIVEKRLFVAFSAGT